MKKPVTIPAKTVLETVLEWSQDRPASQRDALRRIVAGGRLDEAKKARSRIPLADRTGVL